MKIIRDKEKQEDIAEEFAVLLAKSQSVDNKTIKVIYGPVPGVSLIYNSKL